jgi:methyl-accepting chemotaxis protein
LRFAFLAMAHALLPQVLTFPDDFREHPNGIASLMSLIRSQHLAALTQAALAGNEAELARLSRKHPTAAGLLAPLFARLAPRAPAAVALQSLEQQSLVLTHAQTLHREQSALEKSVGESRDSVGQLTDYSAGMSTMLQQALSGIEQAAKAGAQGSSSVGELNGQLRLLRSALSAMHQSQSLLTEQVAQIRALTTNVQDIAHQTNLVALNAAIEAARAGDAGRGFAVVASEVRTLAQRSSQAAKDIKDLIANSSGQVQQGVELVNKTGSALDEIAAAIKEVAELVSDIAGAAWSNRTASIRSTRR